MGGAKRIPAAFAHRVSPESLMLGEALGKITDAAEPAIRAKFPGIGERCKSCAFRGGTIPNACIDTVLEAFDCAIRGEPFWCHHQFNVDGTPARLCGGWQVALGSVPEFVAEFVQPAIDEFRRCEAEDTNVEAA